MEQYSANARGADIFFQKSRNASIGSHTIVEANDTLGRIVFQGSNGTSFDTAVLITGETDAMPGSSSDMGRLVFWTTPRRFGYFRGRCGREAPELVCKV
jgi:hypothetical protein